ncbi:hypothetical protein [Paenibacillus marinisediminis]
MKPITIVSTEHMFVTSTRLPIVQEIVMASGDKALQRALRKLRPMMESDLEQLLLEATKTPLAVRLLDTPLPQLLDTSSEQLSSESAKRDEELFSAVYDMQLEALFRAWLRCRTQGAYRIPVVVLPSNSMVEVDDLQQLTKLVAKQVLGEEYKYCHYRVERETSALA